MKEVSTQKSLAVAVAPLKKPTPKLLLIERLLEVFHDLEIKYCHIGKAMNREASMVADSDLDILFDESQKPKLEVIFKSLGFRKFLPIAQKRYKDIEDYIGLDLPSGNIVHVHTHFRLTLGECLKGHQLGMESRILETRVFDKEFYIFRMDPAFGLILLYFRQAFKIRARDILNVYFRRKTTFSGLILKEYQWLKTRCTNEEIQERLKVLICDHQAACKLVVGSFNSEELMKLNRVLRKEFKDQRLFSPLQAIVLRWYREAYMKTIRKWSQIVNLPIVTQRINPCGGLVVAVVGADGSGKSTVIANLQSTFKKKLDVCSIYFGKGKAGGLPLPRRLLVALKNNLTVTKKMINKKNSTENHIAKQRGVLASLFFYIEAIMVAGEKYRRLKKMQAAKNKGMLVICDRFPQNQIMGYNDGPALHYLSQSSNPFLKIISKIERRVYDLAAKNQPDLVLKLIADTDLIMARKPGASSFEVLQKKVSGIKSLMFGNKCRVVTIDASLPLTEVLCTVKKELWNACP